MITKGGHGFRIVVISTALVAFVAWALSYHPFEFVGGIGIHDSGFFSYPRYRAQLGDIPLWKDGQYTFTLRGLPPDPLDLVLQFPADSDVKQQEAKALHVLLSVSIADSSGKEICSASGVLSDGRDGVHSDWVLTSGSTDKNMSFWHPQCEHLLFSRFKKYSVKFALSGASDSSPDRMISPVLEGGGNELP